MQECAWQSLLRVPAIRDHCRATCLTHISEAPTAQTIDRPSLSLTVCRSACLPVCPVCPVCPEFAIVQFKRFPDCPSIRSWRNGFCRPPGHAAVASPLQTQSDRAELTRSYSAFRSQRLGTHGALVTVLLFPSPSATQPSTTRTPVPRRIQLLLGGSVSTSTKIPHRIDPSTWADAQFPLTRLAGPRHYCPSSKTVVVLIYQ